MRFSPRVMLAVPAAVLYLSTPLAAQFGSVITSPPLNPYEPAVLSDPATRVKERILTKEWRERYNVYELTALIWQLYQVNKDGLDWEGIFGLLTGAMEEEVSVHREHYAGMLAGGPGVQQYHVVGRIIGEFRTVLHYGRSTTQLLDDPAVWAGARERERILDICGQIRSRALRTLEHLPVVAGITEELPADGGQPGTAVQEKYWATPADRLQQLDRMYVEVRALRQDMVRLHLHVGGVDAARRTARVDRAAGSSLLLPAN